MATENEPSTLNISFFSLTQELNIGPSDLSQIFKSQAGLKACPLASSRWEPTLPSRPSPREATLGCKSRFFKVSPVCYITLALAAQACSCLCKVMTYASACFPSSLPVFIPVLRHAKFQKLKLECCSPCILQACITVQVVKALQSLLSKAAAVMSPSPAMQTPTIAHAGPVQSRRHSLFQLRSQWAPVASAHDPAHFAAELVLGHSAPGHSLTQAADRYEHHQCACMCTKCRQYHICEFVLASGTEELWLVLLTYVDRSPTWDSNCEASAVHQEAQV